MDWYVLNTNCLYSIHPVRHRCESIPILIKGNWHDRYTSGTNKSRSMDTFVFRIGSSGQIRPRLYSGLACIGMYWHILACIGLYKPDTDKYNRLQIFGLNTAQYRRNPTSIHREWIGMYWSVMVCTLRIGIYCSVLVCILILPA